MILKRYCFYCEKKINYQGGSNKFCSDSCQIKHQRELNRFKQEKFIKGKK